MTPHRSASRRRLAARLAAVVLGLASIGRAAGGDVKMTAPKAGVVELSNGRVTATIDTTAGAITSLLYNGHQMVNTGRGHNRIYFSRDGGGDYEQLGHCVGSVISQTADGIDYGCKHVYDPAKGDKHAWDVDVHFVVRRGVPGVYVYANTSHPARYPAVGVGEWRMVWSTPGGADELDTIFVDENRHWKVPSFADMGKAVPVDGAPKEVSELTSGPWKGRYDCKYMYAGQYQDIRCWGFASDTKKRGAWVVMPSCEWFNDGPNKQDLDVAVGTTLVHLNMNHYAGTGMNFPPGRAWEKMYGPYLLYLNDKPTALACWQDAKERVKAEAAQWPYAWVKHPNYPPAAGRGTVRGVFKISDALKPDAKASGAWIGLAQPSKGPETDFEHQADGYQFWTRVNTDGTFDIPAVRPGDYALYAYATGEVGQFEKSGVRVSAGGVVDLKTVTWQVPHAGRRLAWEIGTPDRTAAEFGHGKDYYLPLMSKRLEKEVPNPLDFTVGRSDPAKDWYYAQTRHATNGGFEPQQWRIHFRLDRAPAGAATLVLAIAGADRAKLNVLANDNKPIDVALPGGGGNGLVREAVHGKYGVCSVPIPAGQLRAGENTITLVQGSVRGDSSFVMYDSVGLELP